MVAKARGDLFDVNIGGAGFHFTSHLIALVALFIACFAVAGYVMFRNDSIPASALKDQDPNFEDIQADSLTLSGSLTTPLFADVKTLVSSTGAFKPKNVSNGTAADTLGPLAMVQLSSSASEPILNSYVAPTTQVEDTYLSAIFGETATIKGVLDVSDNVPDTSFNNLSQGYNFYAFAESKSTKVGGTIITLPAPAAGRHVVLTGFQQITITTGTALTIDLVKPVDDNSRIVDMTDSSVTDKGTNDSDRITITETVATGTTCSQGILVLQVNSESTLAYCPTFITNVAENLNYTIPN